MDMNNKYTGFEKLLKDKFGNFEYPYNKNDWHDFEKKLPKSTKPFISANKAVRYLVIAAAVIVPVCAILYFNNYTTNHVDKNNAVVSNNHNNNSKTQSVINDQNNTNTQSNDKLNNFTKENNSGSSIDKNTTKNNSNSTTDNSKNNIVKNNSTVDNSTNNSVVDKATATSQNSNPLNSGIITADVTEGCAPLNVKFTPAIISDTITYQWAFGDSKTSTKKSPTHTYTKSGSFTVTLTATFKKSGHVKKISYADFITVKAKPEAKFTASVDKETNVYTFTDNSVNAFAWNWSLGDKTISKVENPTHEYTLDGSYNVTLVAYSLEGCSDTSASRISVKNTPPFYLPTAFAPDGVSDKYFGPKGDDMNAEGYKFSIYDKSGKLVFETVSLDEKWDGKIKGTNSDAPVGAYVCKITMKDKHGILQNYWPLSVTLIR
jgi:PKD repeat protein